MFIFLLVFYIFHVLLELFALLLFHRTVRRIPRAPERISQRSQFELQVPSAVAFWATPQPAKLTGYPIARLPKEYTGVCWSVLDSIPLRY